MRRAGWISAVSVAGLTAAMSGCGAGVPASSSSSTAPVVSTPTTPYVPPVGNYVGAAFGGTVLAGGTPVVGASVQLYAAGTTGNGSAPVQLLANALATGANGGFQVAAGYTCPLSASVLYVVASGGQVAGQPANGALELMTSPGACSSLATGASFVLNEATTVGSAYAFAQFLSVSAQSAVQLGATSTNSSGIALAAGTLANLVNLATGTSPGPGFPSSATPAGSVYATTGQAVAAKIGSLANAVHGCAASSGAGSTACAALLSAAPSAGGVGPANTLAAVVDVVQAPGTNVAPVYRASLASSAFSPVLAGAPADWMLYATYAGGGMNGASAVSIDSMGRVWVASYFGVASLFSNTGSAIYGSLTAGGTLYESFGGAVDANDTMWVTNEQSVYGTNGGNGSVSLLSSAGTAPAGSPYAAGGIDFPLGMAIDGTGVAWITDYNGSSVTLLSAAGVPLSGSSGYNGVDAGGKANFQFPVAVAVDGNRNGWVANQSSDAVTKVTPDGSSYTSYVTGGGPSGVAVDANNNVWVANQTGSSVAAVTAAGVVLPAVAGGGIDHPLGVAVDGNGTVWVGNYRSAVVTELAGVGSASGAGTVLSPPAGWAADAAQADRSNLLESYGVAIDASGNVWVSAFGGNVLTELIGVAAPVKTPLLGPVRVP